jgi:hypothetical protein
MIQSKAKNTAHWNSLVSVKSFQSSILRQPHDSYAKSTIKAVFLPERSCNYRGNLKKNNLSVSQMIVEGGGCGRMWGCSADVPAADKAKPKKRRGCVVMGFIIPRTHGWCGGIGFVCRGSTSGVVCLPTFFFTSKTNYKRILLKAWRKIKEGTKEMCTAKKKRLMKFLERGLCGRFFI